MWQLFLDNPTRGREEYKEVRSEIIFCRREINEIYNEMFENIKSQPNSKQVNESYPPINRIKTGYKIRNISYRTKTNMW